MELVGHQYYMDWGRDRLLSQGFFSSKCEILSTREMESQAKGETEREEKHA